MNDHNTLLHIDNVHTFYGRIEALRGVTLSVHEGEIVALIGANGAGKSTLLMTICANPPARTGQVYYQNEPITQLATCDIVRRGIAHSPEGRRIFARMTVLENLQLGATVTNGQHLAHDLDRIFTLFPLLAQRRQQRAGTLSGGEQQMLAIGRALMSRPRLLLLDEPSLGLAPLIARHIFQVIKALNARDGMTVLLVEQDAYHALKIAHRGCVLVNGQVTLTGTGQELLANPAVRSAYLEGDSGHPPVQPSESPP